MNDLANALKRLYEPDDAPVVAVSGGCILFYNTAAIRLFPKIEEGAKASSVLPGAFIECDDEVFVCTAKSGDYYISANGVWYSGMLLLRMNIADNRFSYPPEQYSAKCRTELTNMRFAIDQLLKDNTADRSAVSVLQRSYFRLLRSCENISIAANIHDKSLVSHPVSMDLKAWALNLIEAVNDAAKPLGISVTFTCSCDNPIITADPALLEQMLLNLFSNSISRLKPGDEINLRISRAGNKIRIALDDSGSGFSKEQLGSMFRRHHVETAEYKGLGLYIVWGIADLHGGTVTISNRNRAGSRVVICIPDQRDRYLLVRSTSEDYEGRVKTHQRILTALADCLPNESF